MLLHVTHRTRYDYAPAVRTAQHMAHLKPVSTPAQRVLSHRLDIDPEPAQRTDNVDVYGNTRTFFNLRSAHDALTVTAHSVVETAPPAPFASAIAWDAVRERLRYHREAAYDPAAEFAFASPLVPRRSDFTAYGRPGFR